MASRTPRGRLSGLPNPALLESAIRRLSRSDLAALCEQLIDRLDAIDGDSDLEEIDAEDSFLLSPQARGYAIGAGCSVSDPDFGIDDVGHDLDPDFERPEQRVTLN